MSASRAAYKDISEADFQDQVYELLHLNGWKVAHFRHSLSAGGRHMTAVQYDATGWPDLFCVHPASRDRFAAELKGEYRAATPKQLEWLAWLEACGIEAHLWKPSMIDAVIARVTKRRR